ncbi:hypothetical protein AG4045_011568 [Apium graveolens]|uniref:Uncharacterized protein n=1 Tax=Apium graveolens TaxID=4045 RepID=A0A6L5B8W6_APIGR|nr:hypothetical protein AG4045_011568 [Apium graveolens]
MMKVQDRRDSPPLWLQLPIPATMLRQRSPASPIFKNSITLVILVPLLLLLIISFLLSFVSQTSQIFRNDIVKIGWDLLNIVLVLFAILCGVVGKLYNDETLLIEHEVAIQTSTVSDQITWNKEISIFPIFDKFDSVTNKPPTSQIVHRGLHEVETDDCNVKVIPVDTCVLRPAQSSTKVPHPPSNPPKSRPKRSAESVSPAEKQHEFVKIKSPTILPRLPLHKMNHTNIAKKGVAGKQIATAIASLYKQAKKKKMHSTTYKKQNNIMSPPPRQVNVVGSNRTREFRVPPQINRAEIAFDNPEIRDVDLWRSQDDLREGNQMGGSVLCPSPDVNVKAGRFIARLREEWKSDQMDS